MKALLPLAVASIVGTFTSATLAQGKAPAPAPSEEQGHDPAPPASTGFQMAIRTGVMVPFGNVATRAQGDDLSMGDAFSFQVPIHVELGGKPIPHLFIGGYLGIGVGGAAGNTADQCSSSRATCVAASARLGVEIQYHFLPDEKTNPWIGYGIGYEAVSLSGDSGSGRVRNTVSGPEYAHFMGGIDFRLGKTLGVGPVLDFSVGTFTEQSIALGATELSGTIDSSARASHFWLLLGGRLVVFP